MRAEATVFSRSVLNASMRSSMDCPFAPMVVASMSERSFEESSRRRTWPPHSGTSTSSVLRSTTSSICCRPMRAMLHPLPGIGGSGVSGQRRAARDLERDLATHAVVPGELITDGGDEAGERRGSGVSLARPDDDLEVPEVVLHEEHGRASGGERVGQ